MLPTDGAVHLGPGGVGLGRQSQECSGERPQRAGWRGFGCAASRRGRCGPVAFGECSVLRVTLSEPAGGPSRCSPLLPLRMPGVGIAVVLWAPDPTSSLALRMLGVATDRLLRMVKVWLLPA